MKSKDEERILLGEKATNASTKEGRLAQKEARQKDEAAYQDSGLLLYGPGIADQFIVSIRTWFFWKYSIKSTSQNLIFNILLTQKTAEK